MCNEFLMNLKKQIDSVMQAEQYEDAIVLMKLYAQVAYHYNQFFCDETMETYISKITGVLFGRTQRFDKEDEIVIFYDGFGLNQRGLIQIYLKGLCKYSKVIYIVDAKAINRIPDVLKILKENNGIIVPIDKKNNIDEVISLKKIIEKYRPRNAFFYSTPWDISAMVAFRYFEGVVTRWLINLTDHAFWLGKNSVDKVIEFRDWGASLSKKYRNISTDKQVLLPFYPLVNNNQEFLGYPFDFDENRQRLIFSGGGIYKTIGGNNNYYKIVDYVLNKYEDIVFWYAGEGEKTEFNKLIKKYPNRLYLTNERNDFVEIIKKSEFYLSTYPICGGLMFQYAAISGKIPLTLKYDSSTDGFLLNQDEIGIEFDTLEKIFNEIDKLLTDSKYLSKKSNDVARSILSSHEFDNQLDMLCKYKKNNFEINYFDVDIDNFISEYKSRVNYKTLCEVVASNRNWIVLKAYPVMFTKGIFYKIYKKLKNR